MVCAQLVDNFSDGELSTPLWIGDVNAFRINEEGQLQLNSTSAGESKLLTKYKLPTDSIKISFWFKMQFAPSGDNNAKIILMADHPDDNLQNAYYLTIGENGTNDAIKVWKIEAGVNTLIGTCTMGEMAGDPALVRLNIKISTNGTWEIFTDYNGGNNLIEDLVINEPIIQLPDSVYFGVNYKYTSTRADKFFIDDIEIVKILPDTEGPKIVNLKVIDEKNIKLTLDEPVGQQSTDVSIYSVNNDINMPTNVIIDPNNPNILILVFGNKPLQSGINYTLKANGIVDRFGNKSTLSNDFKFSVPASKGDLIINELLTDPLSGGEDYIEIFNRSAKSIDLTGLVIVNITKNDRKMLSGSTIIDKNGFLCISKNIAFLKNTYKIPDTAHLKQDLLPSLNISDAYIGIEQNGILLDSFSYDESLHYPLIDETKGVSIERISINGPSNERSNWHSAASTVNFGTPGYANSQYREFNNTTSSDIVRLDRKIISPDNDGIDDFVNIQFLTEKSGFLASISIFDSEGYKIFDLGQNLLLPAEGSLQWNGVDHENKRMRMGIYIMAVKLIHPDGDTYSSKHVITVTDTF
jgi:hypothetical protein